MKIPRLMLAVLAGLFTISLIAELIEALLVFSVSDTDWAQLSQDQEAYFAIRNQSWILIAKMGYSLLAGYVGGWVLILVATPMHYRLATFLLIGLQMLALIWAGFISGLSATGPAWMWIGLLIVIPGGIIWASYRAW